MSKRRIEVTQEVERWREEGRDIKVKLHLDASQSTSVRLSRDEAQDLQEQLTNYLWRDEVSDT